MPRPRTARCGTLSGYARHKLDDNKPCDACTAAKREYDKRWRAAPERTRKSRLSARAQQKAYGRLAREFPDKYAAYYAEAKADLMNGDTP